MQKVHSYKQPCLESEVRHGRRGGKGHGVWTSQIHCNADRKECNISVDHFSPTPGLAVARLMMSLAIANDMELHKIDIEQAFLQADKLDEGVNGRYFINPPPGSPEATRTLSTRSCGRWWWCLLFVLAETKFRSQAPYIPLGRYVP